MNNEKINEQLIRLAFSKNIRIHISLKDGTWRNGFVKEILGDTFELEDRENGIEPFFYIQLMNVEPFTEVREKGVEDGRD